MPCTDKEFNEEEIFRAYKETKDKKLKDKIIAKYMYIAEILSKRFANRGIDYDDIFQVACLGLVLAVDRYEYDKGIKFASFATPTVTGEIKKYFRDKGCFIKIPRKLYEIFVKAEKLRLSMEPEKFSRAEIAKALNLSEKDLAEAYAVGDVAFIQSLEQEAHRDGNSVYGDTLGFDDKNFLLIENSDFLNFCMNSLNQREQEFINLRFHEEKTQKEISKLWEISQMQVSRFEKSVLKKLRNLYYK